VLKGAIGRHGHRRAYVGLGPRRSGSLVIIRDDGLWSARVSAAASRTISSIGCADRRPPPRHGAREVRRHGRKRFSSDSLRRHDRLVLEPLGPATDRLTLLGRVAAGRHTVCGTLDWHRHGELAEATAPMSSTAATSGSSRPSVRAGDCSSSALGSSRHYVAQMALALDYA